MNTVFDVIVLGGGAAGLMCALTAGQRGKRVLVLEKSNKLGKKILMSGGGRCNFTNLDVLPEHYLCPNPHFVKSALSQYTQWDFIAMVAKHSIPYHEKKHGQLFCDNSAKDILHMLVTECELGKVEFVLDTEIKNIEHKDHYLITTDKHRYSAYNLVLATGGLSIPSLGGSGFAYEYAGELGLHVNKTEASLVPFTLTGHWFELAKSLSGVSLPVVASVPSKSFFEDLLFTHRGLSGPAILQLSNYWNLGEIIEIDLAPEQDIKEMLLSIKKEKPNSKLVSAFRELWPRSFTLAILNEIAQQFVELSLQEIKNEQLISIATQINQWTLKPSGTEGYRTAEVTRGGIDVSVVSSKTMQVESPYESLFIIGEALDVTGHLGGFNFQWAWSSGYVAGTYV